MEISNLINDVKEADSHFIIDTTEGYDIDSDDDSNITDILSEASATLSILQQRTSEMTMTNVLMDDNDLFSLVDDNNDSSTFGGPVGVRSELSATSPTGSANAPPDLPRGAVFEVDELPDDEDEEESVEEVTVPISSSNMIVDFALDSFDKNSLDFKQTDSEAPNTESEKQNVEATFTELLKATIQDTDRINAELSEESQELVSSTVQAVSSEDFASLDMRSILGEALFSLSSSMGIDVSQEVAQSGTVKKEMQSIMQANIAELSTNMKQLDEESNMLFEKLNNLRTDLVEETIQFEEKKQDELDDLLFRQSQMKVEYSSSQVYLKESTDRLQKVMEDVTENADVITSLALFPIKSIDQKLAFVVGLSVLLKVPFDSIHLLQIRDFDTSIWTSLALQFAVSVACFHHYGLVKALFNTLNSGNKKS
mmetsp:Transcript_24128/g.33156  ORF Transcript_24128/g.33156 Transcript_24128/m.33156 type:complete len:425 (+) Transcript_24128:234-1508(+)